MKFRFALNSPQGQGQGQVEPGLHSMFQASQSYMVTSCLIPYRRVLFLRTNTMIKAILRRTAFNWV